MSAARESGRPSSVRKAVWKGYTLVVCEKPDAARRVAEALSSGAPEAFEVGPVKAFRLRDSRGRPFVVCAAAGHLYGLADTVKDRKVYPALDLEWFPLAEVSKGAKHVPGRIRAIQRLSEDASEFVNACDYDVEGETIGYNILRYACGGKESSALRARFSSLTKEDVVEAFGEGRLTKADGRAMAGRLRHAVDFVWGVNLSRALSEALRVNGGYRTVSIGRVQGPTLSFLVERETEVQGFVPTPYWKVAGRFRGDGEVVVAKYATAATLPTSQRAMQVKADCEGREGIVSRVSATTFNQRPPPPFNLADLQKEAFRQFGYAPSRTLQVAERLYLAAMISYPRTGSQKLPRLDLPMLLKRLGEIPGYGDLVGRILSLGHLHPEEGSGVDPAHPAIYPTGVSSRRPLSTEERRVFDLVVRRFLSCFGEDAVKEVRSADIQVGGHVFRVEETGLLVAGWTALTNGARWETTSSRALELRQGDRLLVEAVDVDEQMRAQPVRYNQATLLEKMEREGIGTKATRADTISTLVDRGYASGVALVPSSLGFALVETMREYCPKIVTTSLTKEVEAQLDKMESGRAGAEFFEETLSSLVEQLGEMRLHEEQLADGIRSSISDLGFGKVVLGGCPVCKEGRLWVVRSRKTGKRFVGCTNYVKGCRASAPLPQRGTLRPAAKPCASCGWPIVYIRAGRRPWRLCVNDRCPRKVNVYSMQNLRKAPGTQTGKKFEKD